MNFAFLLPVALGLSMDAFAVSVSQGLCISPLKARHILKIALAFGFFQGLMPVIGWLAGTGLASFIASVDHWVACLILVFIGGKMIYEGIKSGREAFVCKTNIAFRLLIILAVATSIDALAVGVTFAFSGIDTFPSMLLHSLVIAGVTFIISAFGVIFGKKVGNLFKKWAEIAGGLILIIIGVKLLAEGLNT